MSSVIRVSLNFTFSSFQSTLNFTSGNRAKTPVVFAALQCFISNLNLHILVHSLEFSQFLMLLAYYLKNIPLFNSTLLFSLETSVPLLQYLYFSTLTSVPLLYHTTRRILVKHFGRSYMFTSANTHRLSVYNSCISTQCEGF